MNILITNRGGRFYADFCDLPGDPKRGTGESEEEAIEQLKSFHKKVKGVNGKHKIKRYG